MALQTSGAISLNDIQAEFGGTNPASLSEYYGADTGIPTSGTISMGDFYGASAADPNVKTITVGQDVNAFGYFAFTPEAGSSISPDEYWYPAPGQPVIIAQISWVNGRKSNDYVRFYVADSIYNIFNWTSMTIGTSVYSRLLATYDDTYLPTWEWRTSVNPFPAVGSTVQVTWQ